MSKVTLDVSEMWERVKDELNESGVPCLNPNCPACTPLKDAIATIDSFWDELMGLGFDGAGELDNE